MDRNLVMTVLEQLRKRLIIIVIAVAAGSILFVLFCGPYPADVVIAGAGLEIEIIFLTPIRGLYGQFAVGSGSRGGYFVAGYPLPGSGIDWSSKPSFQEKSVIA